MGRLHFLINEPLAPRTSLTLGGTSEALTEVSTVAELVEALSWAETAGYRVHLLGGGSNVVISDEGVSGLVVVPALRGIDIDRREDGVVVVAAAGEIWDDLVAETIREKLLGLECLSGIPGTVGATPIQNVGAYGVEISDVIEWVEVLDREDHAITRWSPSRCSFGYRTSCFRRQPDRWVVTRVALRLQEIGRPVIRYPELARAVGAGGVPPDSAAVRDAVINLRRSKGMVLEDGAPRSVGSFFVNPVVDAGTVSVVEEAAGGADSVPRFPAGERLFKIPAAWLIENSGFGRGYRRGSVGISEHHALALVHHGGGRTRDLLELASSIRSGVEQRFGIVLRPEPMFWGCPASDPLNGDVP